MQALFWSIFFKQETLQSGRLIDPQSQPGTLTSFVASSSRQYRNIT
jgi:hypothetical protein